MAANIPSQYQWTPVDVEYGCRNWTPDLDGTERRLWNSAAAINGLVGVGNHLLGRSPRTSFCQYWPVGKCDTSGLNPLHRWRYNDNLDNGRTVVYRIIALTRATGAGDAKAYRTGDSATATPAANGTDLNAAFPSHVFYHEIRYSRGNPNNAEIAEGLSTQNGYTVLDVVAQDEELGFLDPNYHLFMGGRATSGDPVVANLLENIRTNFHEHRRTCLPIVGSWAAVGTTTKPGAAPGDHTGLRIDSTSFVNVFDQTVTARTAYSEGISAHRQWAGVGAEDEDYGKRVKIVCAVYAEKDSADAGVVRFIGPDHVASNSVDITVTGDAAAGWFGGSTNYVYLNPAAANTLETTARNKIDIHAKCTSAGQLYIWGIRLWEMYWFG